MSADGSVAAGVFNEGFTNDVFRWTAAGGVEILGVLKQAKYNNLSISRDGKTIIGTVPDSQKIYHAAIWQDGKNWRVLAPFPGAVPGENNYRMIRQIDNNNILLLLCFDLG